MKETQTHKKIEKEKSINPYHFLSLDSKLQKDTLMFRLDHVEQGSYGTWGHVVHNLFLGYLN